MEIGKLPMAIVGITIAVIVCAVVLIPVVQESTTSYDTFLNEGLYKMKKIDTDTEMTLSWTYENPTVITVDDVDVSIPSSGIIWYTLIGSSDYFVRWIPNDALALFEENTSSNLATIAGHQNLDITISSGTITFDNGSVTPKTITFDEFSFVIADDGDYVMKGMSETAYVLSNSQITGIGRTSLSYTTPVSVSYYVSGSIDDGFTIDHFGTNATITDGEPVVAATIVSGHEDLYLFNSINWTATSGEENANVTYSQVIVPSQVVAERSIHPDATTTQLINVIPILVIIGIVMLAVTTMIYYRR